MPLFVLCVLCASAIGATAQTTAVRQPVLWYAMAAGEGGSLREGRGGNDAQLAGAVEWVSSMRRAAPRFDGASTVATLDRDDVPKLSTSFSVDLWYNARRSSEPVGLVVLPSTFRLLLYPSSSKFLVDVLGAKGGRIYAQPEAPVRPGVWQHVALTYAQGAGAALYLDGTQLLREPTDVGELATGPEPLRIGLGAYPMHRRFFRGLMAGLRLWDTALTQQEIREMIRAEKPELTGTFRGPDDIAPKLPPATPIDVGGHKQLFIDERFVEASRGIELNINPPTKLGPILTPHEPWEMNFGFCASVIEHEGVYKLFYRCEPPQGAAKVCLAISEDGLQWQRPRLGLFEYAGSKQNNIVYDGVGEAVVFLDPHGTPDERFKMIVMHKWPDPEQGGLYCHTSPDGIHWRQGPHVLNLGPDTANQAAWDVQRGKYVAYVRKWDALRKVGRIEMDDVMKPWPYEDLGDDAYFIWGRDKIPVPSKEMPTAFGYDETDPVESDHYNPAAVEYLWAQSAYFMFPSAYMHHPSPPPNDGLLDIQLAVSRDGVEFTRPQRRPYVPLGLAGDVDSQCQYMAVGMLRVGSCIYQYYGGYSVSHGRHNEARTQKRRQGSLCAVRQRLDGFMSADAAYTGGELLTPPMSFEGGRLELNINASAMGACQVGILDAQGEPIEGYSADECDFIHGNHVARAVTWGGKEDVSALTGRTVRLHFVMRATRLYAFQFRGE